MTEREIDYWCILLVDAIDRRDEETQAKLWRAAETCDDLRRAFDECVEYLRTEPWQNPN